MEALFTLFGASIPGKRLGTQLGFPTANLALPANQEGFPKNGVYIAAVHWDGQDGERLGVLNQGTHPTVPEGQPTVEIHLPRYSGGSLYGRQFAVRYLHFLREEAKFSSLEALTDQLTKDRDEALRWARDNAPELLRDDMTDYPVEIRNAVYTYEEDASPAVDHISLTIRKGEFLAVLGHNGSGKSTLSKLMNALYLPDEGQVLICGTDTAAEDEPWKLRRHAGMVFQNPDNQIVANVVREDVAFGLENLGIEREEMIRRIDSALEAVHMTEFAQKGPQSLSGGQKQRVAVAGVLAMEPDVMILDEATAMLDPSGRKSILETAHSLNRERGITVIWITHFMEEAADADRVLVLDSGRAALEGTPREVFSRVDEIKALGLDVPPMAELAAKLNRAGFGLREGILTVEEMTKELTNRLCPS